MATRTLDHCVEEYANNIAEFVEENLQSLGEINEEGLQRYIYIYTL
jgi:hypothetical protein